MVRPDDGSCGDLVKTADVGDSGARFVVIATDKQLTQRAGLVENLVGIGAVADDVAKIGNNLTRRGGGKTSFEGVEIGVNIAE